jgi:glutathione S-transferase
MMVITMRATSSAGIVRSGVPRWRARAFLYKQALTRRLILPRVLRGVFASDPADERELLAQLPPKLDRIDAWIADGILGGAQLNVADFMVAPSLALILYRPDVMSMFEGRPALELVDRLLPEPP